jgi:2-oxoglutarate/2-oxoacid ferredoxin oxidoreductase subunit beta
MAERVPLQLTAKEFKSDQEVRWCPGCGDYAILAAMQAFMPELGIARENTVFISGIGCSSRFPYYMNTYGMHSIHGRAPAIATGLAVSRPDLSVWVVTGDGDALSIGGNHLIHALRRNVNVKILLFNNRIYGLTKGQYSPTSEIGKVTKSTPVGSADAPFNPLSLALGAEASFVARSIDSDRKHLTSVLRAAAAHEGSAFVEIYQNCNIFNDDAFEVLKNPATRDDYLIRLEHGRPVTFGAARQPNQSDGGAARQPNQSDGGAARQPNQSDGGAARQPNQSDGGAEGEWCVTHPPGAFGLEVRKTSEVPSNEILVHDETIPGPAYAFALSRLPQLDLRFTPIGVFRNADRPSYDSIVRDQVETAKATVDDPDAELASLLSSGDTWTIV